MTDKDKIINAEDMLDNITGGALPPMPQLKCKSCGKEITLDDYGKYLGLCLKCGANEGKDGGW